MPDDFEAMLGPDDTTSDTDTPDAASDDSPDGFDPPVVDWDGPAEEPAGERDESAEAPDAEAGEVHDDAPDLDSQWAERFGLNPRTNVRAAQESVAKDFERVIGGRDHPAQPFRQAAQAQPPEPRPDAAQAKDRLDGLIEQFGDDIKPLVDEVRALRSDRGVPNDVRQRLERFEQYYEQQQQRQVDETLGRFFEPKAKAGFDDVYGGSTPTPSQTKARHELAQDAAYYQAQKYQREGVIVSDEQALEAAFTFRHREKLLKAARDEGAEQVRSSVVKRQATMDLTPTGRSSSRSRAAPSDGFDRAIDTFMARR